MDKNAEEFSYFYPERHLVNTFAVLLKILKVIFNQSLKDQIIGIGDFNKVIINIFTKYIVRYSLLKHMLDIFLFCPPILLILL